MRWGHAAARPPDFANRYVERFAWYPMWDYDAQEYVWLERFHRREYWSPAFNRWRNVGAYEGFADHPVISDSRKRD